MKEKERLDVLLVKRGFFESREKAKAAVIAGVVKVNGNIVTKPDLKIPVDSLIEIKEAIPYVSRGGFKLKKAIDTFGVDVRGKVALDVGASTGGFTDCLLQEGAIKVYAVDVGKGQLHEKLRKDPRVIVKEGINARYLKEEDIPDKVDVVTIDVSFISLLKIFPAIRKFLYDDSIIISLIKPQFEASPKEVSRGGIVKNIDVHIKILENIKEKLKEQGFFMQNVTYYLSKEGKGNIEYPSLFTIKQGTLIESRDIERVVQEAFLNWKLRYER